MEGHNASDFGVNLIAYIRAEMGLGTAARGLACALESADIPFNLLNFEHANPSLHRDESWKHKEVDSSSYDFTILAVNPDNFLNARERVQEKFVKGRYTIGYWFWELPEIPDNWLPSFSWVDEVWTGSRFGLDAMSLRSPVPVFRVPVPVCLGPTEKFGRAHFGLPARQFLFLSMSDAHSELARKNPLGAVRAFKKAFAGKRKDVGLILKINNAKSKLANRRAMAAIRREIKGYSNIYLLDQDLTRAEVDALLNVSDSFISLHRSEGFGLGPAEAMSLAKPVILTNWSGNLDYMRPDNSIAIDYKLVPLGKQYGPYPPEQVWAEPDLDQAAYWMKQLVSDSGLAKKIGQLGQETIRNEFSPKVVGELVRSRLASISQAGFRTAASTRAGSGPLGANSTPEPSLAAHPLFTVYCAGHSEYSEDLTVEVSYKTQRWSHLHIPLENGLGIKRLRLDPTKTPGLIDVAGLAIRSAIESKVLWKANGKGGLEGLEVGGSAVKLPHPRIARFLSYGDDPQIYLPLLAGPEFDEPLRLEVWLRVETGNDAIRAGVASVPSANPQALAAIDQAQALLKAAADSVPRAELEEALKALAQKSAELATQNLELAEARSALEERSNEVERLKQDVVHAQTKHATSEEELEKRTADLAAKEQALTVALDELKRAETTLIAREAELESVTSNLDVARTELSAAALELTGVTNELSELKRQFRNYKAQSEKVPDDKRPLLTRVLDALAPKKKATSSEKSLPIRVKSPRPMFWIERPTASITEGATVTIAGWVLSSTGGKVEGVRAVIDGRIFVGEHGFERRDVAAQENNPDAAFCGFSVVAALSPGVHLILLERRSRGRWEKFSSFRHEVRYHDGAKK